jgi:hypothetical protein
MPIADPVDHRLRTAEILPLPIERPVRRGHRVEVAEILSASFTSCASGLASAACSIWSRLRSALGSDLSSVTSATIALIFGPKRAANSAGEVWVSSTVSWRIAAAITSASSMPASFTRRSASAIG